MAPADVVNGLGQLLQNIRYAVRRLLADSRLTITAVMTLSLGVGSAVVMMDMLDRLLLRPPKDVRDPGQVTRLYTDTGSDFITVTDYRTVDELERELGAEFEHIAAYRARSLSLGRGVEAEPIEVIAHGPRYFDVLGTPPQLGSLAAATPDAPQHAVISDSLWRRRFGGAPDVIGEPLRLGTDVYTIAAVLPRGFAGVDYTAADVWVPLTVNPSSGAIPFLNVIARLRPDVDRRVASIHATAVYGASHPREALVFGDLSRSPEMSETTRVAIWIGGISVLVLLIACGNVANLLYVRIPAMADSGSGDGGHRRSVATQAV
jgi:putative ABC transport system permease protein